MDLNTNSDMDLHTNNDKALHNKSDNGKLCELLNE
jgi:hypothetical protein